MSQRAYYEERDWTSSKKSGTGYGNRKNSDYSRAEIRKNAAHGRTEIRRNTYDRAKNSAVEADYGNKDNYTGYEYDAVSRTRRRAAAVKKGRVRNSALRKPVYIVRKDNKARISFLTLITIFVIFAGGMGLAMTSAAITDCQTRRAAMQNEIKKLQELNNGLRAEVSQNMKIDDIERIAVNELGMIKPKAYQIINLDVAKQSYVIQNPDFGKSAKKGFDIRDIFNMIKVRVAQ